MPSVFKVGITTNSVRQRIHELNTTGVPKPFRAEKIFEVDARYLRVVEQLAHSKLKQKDLHHGKEFFEGRIEDCIEAVEDAIFEHTHSHSQELVGKAAQRAAEEDRRREEERARVESERIQSELRKSRLRTANIEIDAARIKYKEQLKREEKDSEPFLERYAWTPVGLVVLGILGLFLMVGTGPIGWIGVPLLAYWIYQRDCAEAEKRLNILAERKYPYKTNTDFD